MANAGEPVISGDLHKKSTGGLKGFKPWSKKYVVVTTKSLSVYKGKDQALESQVSLLDIRSVQSLPDKRLGDRFDIVLKNGVVYALHSASQAESVIWTRAIENAILAAKQEEKAKEKKTNILDNATRDQTRKFSGLQRMFFDAWFGEAKMYMASTKENYRETQAILSQIDKEFVLDSDVLRFLLLRFMAPSLNIFTYNEQESKEAEGRFQLGATVQEVCTCIGTLFNIKMDDTIKAFEEHLLYDIRDVIDSYIPSSIPQRISTKIKEILDDIKEQQKSNYPESKVASVATGTPTAQDRIIAMVKSPQMMRNLVLVFRGADTQAHGLAVRLLWAIYNVTLPFARAMAEFSAQVSVQCGGQHLSGSTCEALLAIALEGHESIATFKEMDFLQFNKTVTYVHVLKPFLGVLRDSNLEFWKTSLSEVTAILHENLKNSTLLVDGNDWQVWLLNLLVDLKKEDKNQEPVKSIFALIVNNFTLIHYNFFTRSPRFPYVIHSTMLRVHQFGGSNRDCQNFLNVLLGALINKLTAQMKTFGSDYQSPEWSNLAVLLTVLRKYVFQTAFLQTTPHLGQLKDKREILNTSEDEGELPAEFATEAFMLARRPPGKTDRKWNSETFELKDFGVHWNPGYDGPCVDVDLPKKVCNLLQKLGVSKVTDDVLYGKLKEDKETLIKLQGEFEFWEDAGVFLSRLKREDISRKHLFSYRRLGHLCQMLCNENSKAGRESVLKQLAQLQAGAGTADDDQSSTPLKDQSDSSTSESVRRKNTEEQPATVVSYPPRGSLPFSSPAMRRIQTGNNTVKPTDSSSTSESGSVSGSVHKAASASPPAKTSAQIQANLLASLSSDL